MIFFKVRILRSHSGRIPDSSCRHYARCRTLVYLRVPWGISFPRPRGFPSDITPDASKRRNYSRREIDARVRIYVDEDSPRREAGAHRCMLIITDHFLSRGFIVPRNRVFMYSQTLLATRIASIVMKSRVNKAYVRRD